MRALLDASGVMVGISPSPTRALTLRVCAQVYNTPDDFEQLADALLAYSRRLERERAELPRSCAEVVKEYVHSAQANGDLVVHS